MGMICEKKELTPVGDMKPLYGKHHSLPHLNTGFPKQFCQYLQYARNMDYYEMPDYEMIIGLMRQCRDPLWKDHEFQWLDDRGQTDNASFPSGPSSSELVPLDPHVVLQQPDFKGRASSKGCFCF